KNYLNKAIIGLGAGLVKSKDILNLSLEPQGAMDILSIWMGQEIAKELLAQKKKLGISDKELIEKLLDDVRIAEELNFGVSADGKAMITIEKCLICPKRVGGYDLGNDTACPVGGIIMGALRFIKGESPSLPKIQLNPGEFCRINMEIEM
ncbi:MAG: hypothetical protein ACTSSF_13535, partial [Candidatus Heimdallarchaeaceae archaeon]